MGKYSNHDRAGNSAVKRHKGGKFCLIKKFCTHVVSIFIAIFCVIKQGITEPYCQNYCHFMRLCGKFIFLHYSIIPIEISCV